MTFKFVEKTAAGNTLWEIEWEDMFPLVEEIFDWRETPTELIFWEENGVKNGIRITIKPNVNLLGVVIGVNAIVDVMSIPDSNIPRRIRMANLSKGWQYYCKESRVFLRCDKLFPAYSEDVQGGFVLSNIDIKIDAYLVV